MKNMNTLLNDLLTEMDKRSKYLSDLLAIELAYNQNKPKINELSSMDYELKRWQTKIQDILNAYEQSR